MANQKGNQYPNWLITNAFQVFAYDSQSKSHQMSKEGFALDIGISEDGTVWVLSTEPDPDGGGSKIYWSNGDNSWNEITTSNEGGYAIAGGTGSTCYYLDADNAIYQLDTNGTATKIYDSSYVVKMDYGGGYIWAILIDANGMPGLYYSKSGSSLSFTKFVGDYNPTDISVDYAGNCTGVDDLDPITFSKDGSSVSSPGTGANGKTIRISSKNWTYLVSSDLESGEYDNAILVWKDESGGEFVSTNMAGIQVAATYYS